MTDSTSSASFCVRHPLAFACGALVVCVGVYSVLGAWFPDGSIAPTAVAAVFAVVFYVVGKPRKGGENQRVVVGAPFEGGAGRREAVSVPFEGSEGRQLAVGRGELATSIFVLAAAVLATIAFIAFGGLATVGTTEGDVPLTLGFGGEAPEGAWGVGALILFCLLTAAFEETLFRGVLYQRFLLLDAQSESDFALRALIAQAVVFAVLHIVGFPAASGLDFGAQVVMLVLRVVAAFLFALLMARLVRISGSLALPIAVHFLYDLMLFAPVFLQGGFVRTNPLAGGIPDLVSVVIQVVVLAVVVVACARRESCYHTPSVS